jgi:hypothetical protein
VNSAAPPITWEDDSVPFPANAGLTWLDCIVSPDRFFSRVAWGGSFARPLLYLLIVAVLAGTLGLFWYLWVPRGGALLVGTGLDVQLLSFFLTPFAVLLGLAVMAVLQHLFVVLLAPDRRGLAATATVLCYGSGVSLVTAALPPALGPGAVLGGALGALYAVFYVGLATAVHVWYVVVLVIGIRRAHGTTTGRAAAIVLLPILIGVTVAATMMVAAILLLPALPELVLP